MQLNYPDHLEKTKSKESIGMEEKKLINLTICDCKAQQQNAADIVSVCSVQLHWLRTDTVCCVNSIVNVKP